MNSSSLMLRRFLCFNASPPSSSSSSSSILCFSSNRNRKPLVFLGSPQVSATVLNALLNASTAPDSLFEVAAIVTQPPSRKNRGKKVLPSPLAQHALDRGFPSDLIFTPARAGEDMFLSSLRALQPELCITAAYGNILPSKFLNIPTLGIAGFFPSEDPQVLVEGEFALIRCVLYRNPKGGDCTVNIHPSLLPLYRGAAPVQRALQDGVKETGVSLAFTVRALDAGPVIASQRLEIDDQIKAPDLLALLFSEGSKLLIHQLPSIFDGSAKLKAQSQDDSKATLAPKISPEESWLSFDQEAVVLHNKVRAFAGWPGTRAKVVVVDDKNGHRNMLELKIITTKVCSHSNIQVNQADDISFRKGALVFPCGGSTSLEVLEIQLPGKKVMNAAAFWNGLRGQQLKRFVDE